MTSKGLAGSLAAFVKAEGIKKGPQCWMCGIDPDVRKEIEKLRREKGYSHAVLARFMRDRLGLAGATFSKVRDHLANHVDAK